MAEEGTKKEQPHKLAYSIVDLPKLPDDFVRIVHLTHKSKVEDVLSDGLSYEKYGMAMSTARAWSKPEEVEFTSEDIRFASPDIVAVVMDLSNEEWKMHNRVGIAPGKIEANKIIGVIGKNQ